MSAKNNAAETLAPVEPLNTDTKSAAALLGMSEQKLRKVRYADEARLAAGEPIHGPPWVNYGRLVRYHLPTLRQYAADKAAAGPAIPALPLDTDSESA